MYKVQQDQVGFTYHHKLGGNDIGRDFAKLHKWTNVKRTKDGCQDFLTLPRV